jgi:hypothetical protein
MESVGLLRQLVLLERDVPAERQSDALRLGRHPFCDVAEGFMLDDTSPLEGTNRRGSAPDAGDGLLVDELVLASTAARGSANRRGTQSRRAAAPCRAPGVPEVSRNYNDMSAGECLKRALDACSTLPSLTSRTAVVHVPLSRYSAAALACQSRYCEAIDISVPACNIVLVHHDPPSLRCLTRVWVFTRRALDRGSVFSLTIRLRESDGNVLSASARDLLELVCSCDSIGEADGEVGGRPECAHANEEFSLVCTGAVLSQCGAIIFRLLRTCTKNQKEPEDWAVCSDEPQSVHMCTKGSALRGAPALWLFRRSFRVFMLPLLYAQFQTSDERARRALPAESTRNPEGCAATRRLRSHGWRRTSRLRYTHPRELSGAASAVDWLHAPGLENGFACDGVDGSGDGGGSSGRGGLPPGGAAHDAMGRMDRMPHQRRSALARALRASIVRGIGGRCSPVSLIFLSGGTAAQRLRRCSQLVLGCLRLTCGTFEVTAVHQPVPQAQ